VFGEAIPPSYDAWRYCIEKKCGIALDAAFIRRRRASLACETAEETIRFRRLYGDAHWRQVGDWFARAERELTGG
jgi:hypothetical protein